MKTLFTIIIISLFLFTISYAGEQKGFLGIPWGASKEKIKEVMSQREGVKYFKIEKDSIGNTIIGFDGGKFGGFNIGFWMFNIGPDGFYSVSIFTPIEFEPQAFDKYNEVVEAISSKYGPPTKIIEKYRSPFSKKDGNEILALKTGHVTLRAAWYLKETLIGVTLSPKPDIMISYRGRELFLKEIERRSAKEKKDF
jgi:hypothetical protein